jgi:hypothetical protein
VSNGDNNEQRPGEATEVEIDECYYCDQPQRTHTPYAKSHAFLAKKVERVSSEATCARCGATDTPGHPAPDGMPCEGYQIWPPPDARPLLCPCGEFAKRVFDNHCSERCRDERRSSEATPTDEERAVRHLAVYPSGPGARKALAVLLAEIRNEERQHAVAWLRRFADERHPIEAGEFLLSPSGRGLLMQAASGIERGEHR